MKLNIFVVAFVCLIQIRLVLSECTTAQNERLEYCYYKYFNSFGISEDSREYINTVSKLAETWTGFLQVCEKLDGLQECLGDKVMKNCMKSDEFLELFDNGLDMAANYDYFTYICGRGFNLKKQTFDCMKKSEISCRFDEHSDCNTLKTALIKCGNEAKKLCGKKGYIFNFNQVWASIKSTFPQCNNIDYIEEKNDLNNDDDESSSTASSDNNFDEIDSEENQKNIYEKSMFILFEKTIKMVSHENFTSENLVEFDVLPLIVESLKSKNPLIQQKAIEVLTVISKEGLSFCHLIIEAEAIPPLINLIESPNFGVSDATLDFFSEILKRSHRFRDYAIEEGILEPIIKLTTNKKTSDMKLISLASVIVRILFHRGSSGSEKIISALLPAINTIFNHEDPKIQILALGSYDFFTDENYAKLFIENGVVKMCIGFLETSMDSNRFEFIMRFFQKMIDEGSDSDIQYFIDNGILRNVQKALKHFNEDVKLVGICLITSLVQSANGTQKHIIFNEPNLFSSIVNLLDHKNPSIRSSTLELLLKYIDRANSKEIIFSMFDSSNCIYQLCALLKENEMPVTILRILQNLLFKADNKTALNIRDILIDCKAEATMKESLSDDSTFLYAANLFSEFYDLNFWEKRAMSKSSHDEL